jgi:lipid II isoglutaminyl synthase (glutamine-hydrolysing)
MRHLDLTNTSWACACGVARPTPDAVESPTGATIGGRDVAYETALPGAFNRANGLAALLTAVELGVAEEVAAAAIASVTEVAGRFADVAVDGRPARLLLAKNPAGWTALLDLVERDGAPLVLVLNAKVADGRDPSWIYDVDFERLQGRHVVASGERWRDLSARLYYADVHHDVDADPVAAVRASGGAGRVDVVANYTAFASLWSQLGAGR